MKKSLITLFATVCFLMSGILDLHAQGESRIGLKGGTDLYSSIASVSFFGLSVEETSDSKFGFAAGIFVEKPFSDLLSAQFEVLYIQKGGKDHFSGTDFDVDVEDGEGKLTLSYLDIPAMLKLNIPIKSESVSPFVYAGGFAGYLLDATVGTDEGSFDGIEIKDLLNDINYGFIMGLGANFGAVSVDLRYDIGLGNIFDSEAELFEELEDELGDNEEFGDLEDLLDSIELTTSGLLLTIGYAF